MKIIAIDPGTKCGWAWADEGLICCGTWDFALRKHEGSGMRFLRFGRAFGELIEGGPDLVAFEDVAVHKGTSAAHVYGGIVGALTSLCEQRNILYVGIPVGRWKKRCVGNGSASREEYLTAARAKWPKLDIVDDNAAAALWLLECAKQGDV